MCQYLDNYLLPHSGSKEDELSNLQYALLPLSFLLFCFSIHKLFSRIDKFGAHAIGHLCSCQRSNRLKREGLVISCLFDEDAKCRELPVVHPNSGKGPATVKAFMCWEKRRGYVPNHFCLCSPLTLV